MSTRSAVIAVLGVIVAGVLAACPGVASASVAIGPEQIVVAGTGAGAIIDRAPFRVTYTDGGGAGVLSEVPSGGESSEGPDYAPLSFLVGSDTPETFTENQNGGDLLSDTESGVWYSAREVVSAVTDGEGVKLTLATNDPSGRQLIVTIAPAVNGTMRLSAVPSDPTGVAAIADSFDSSPSEAFHGFGGRHNSIDQHGQDFYNWVDQENFGAGSPEVLSPDGPQAAYYVQSSFVSNQGYGFLLDRNEISRWRLDSDRPDAWQAEVAAPAIDYVVAPGNMMQSAASLTAITGRQRVPPAWALGPAFDREGEFGVGAATYEEQVQSDLQNIAKYKLPLSAYRIEDWQFLSPSALASVISQLHTMGIHPLVYFRPFVGQEKIGQEEPSAYNTAVENGYVAKTEGGQPYLFTDNFFKTAALIDFTNPAAVTWWKGRIDAALELGADGFMLDFGEQVQPGMRFSDGSTGAQMHNRYPVLYHQVTSEAVAEYESLHPGRTIFYYTRSGYTGDPGSAAYEGANFPGDETTDWGAASGLASLTPDMLNRVIGGAFGYTTDIGGYYDVGNGRGPTSRELFLRWAEWAALSPLFRLHGAILEEHTPWSKRIHAVGLYKKLSQLHISAEPLISMLWKQADETGVPITRPLYLEYPTDAQAALQQQEWLLGPDVLVAPVIEQAATTKQVYFPSGCWRNPETGQEVTGPRYETVAAEVKQLPFYFRCGTEPFRPYGRFGHALPR
ncbi:MAG TPA: TIM-barrel domain-containing protein [Solirubrobacteraceae bacterium]|nr:TIM-barrel domain-containing protein [Solirubrobacteraceae bacterium]